MQGNPTLITDEGEQQLSPGMCAGFRAGSGNAHHLVNNTNEEVIPILATLTTDSVEYNLSRVEGKIWQEFIT